MPQSTHSKLWGTRQGLKRDLEENVHAAATQLSVRRFVI
jgi:hypothetical protein